MAVAANTDISTVERLDHGHRPVGAGRGGVERRAGRIAHGRRRHDSTTSTPPRSRPDRSPPGRCPTRSSSSRRRGSGRATSWTRRVCSTPTGCGRTSRRATEDQLGVQAEMAMPAIVQALAQAGRTGADVDAVIVGCSNLQRAYPAVAIEIQDALGASGWAYDMNVACSSATFSIQAAVDALRNGSASCVVVVNPEITSGHTNFELRDFHFIFGDACTALVLERTADAVADDGWDDHRDEAGHAVLEQHPQRLRVPEQSPRTVSGTRTSWSSGRTARWCSARCARWSPPTSRRTSRRTGFERRRRAALLAAPGEPEDEPADRQGRARPCSRPTTRRRPSSTSTPTRARPARSSPSTSTAATSSTGDVGVICSFGAGYSVGSVIVRRAVDRRSLGPIGLDRRCRRISADRSRNA